MIVSVPFAFQVRLLQGLVKLETELARRTACRAQVKELKSEKLSPCSSGNLKGFKCLRAVRLARSVSNLTSPCNERTWNAKGTDTIMTSPEREPPKTSTKRSAALRSPTGITPLGVYPLFIAIKGGGRPTPRLPHAKMLLVPISFSSAG